MTLSQDGNPNQSAELTAKIHCPACRALCRAASVEIPDHEYGLVQLARYAECEACGTLFQVPMPGVSELAAYYPPDYHSMTHAGFLNRVRNELRVHRLSKLVHGNGPVLDFGCGDGAFLVQASERMRDRQFWGFEIAERETIEHLRNGSVKIVKGDLRDLLRILPRCSAITMNHVIEHLPEPSATMSALAERLEPGGILEGQTPAADSLERTVFGRKWSGYHAPRHTVIFSKCGLHSMLRDCGLTSISTDAAFNPAGIAVSLGSLGHRNGGRIKRAGSKWLALMAAAAVLAPIDLLSGRPGIMNFAAYRNPE